MTSLYQRRFQPGLDTTQEAEDPSMAQPPVGGTSLYAKRVGTQPQPAMGAAPEDDGFSFTTMLSNVPESGYNAVANTVQAVAHPVETAQNLYELGWDGLMKFYADRYGSVENFLKTLESDPVGVVMEGSALASGGGTLAARLPGAAGAVGRAAQTAGRLTDPVYGATKAVGGAYKGTKRALQYGAGGASASYQAPRVAAEMGYESAYQGVNKAVTGKPKTEAPEMFKGQMRDKRAPDEGVKLIDEGEKSIRQKAQTELDNALAPLYADKRPFGLDKIDDALQDAYNIADTGSEASKAVQVKLAKVVDEWREPKWYKKRTFGPLTDPAKTIVPEKDIKAAGLDPATATHRDFLISWYERHRSAQGMDRLKRQLEAVYPGYRATRLGNQSDRMAQQVSAKVVNSVKDTLRSRYGDKYDAAMKPYGAKMQLIQRIRETFGRKEDTVGRRLTSMNRDTVFADFGNRASMLKEFAKEAGIPEANLPAIAAGRSVRGFTPRGMMGMTAGAGLTAAFWSTPMAAVVAALHLPRLVGEASYAAGKLEGLIVKPMRAVENALNKTFGITKHGLTSTGGQIGQKAQAGDNKAKLRQAIEAKAKAMGYNIHGRLISKVADQLTSEDPKIWVKGLQTVSQNKRIMKLIEEMGKGEE